KWERIAKYHLHIAHCSLFVSLSLQRVFANLVPRFGTHLSNPQFLWYCFAYRTPFSLLSDLRHCKDSNTCTVSKGYERRQIQVVILYGSDVLVRYHTAIGIVGIIVDVLAVADRHSLI